MLLPRRQSHALAVAGIFLLFATGSCTRESGVGFKRLNKNESSNPGPTSFRIPSRRHPALLAGTRGKSSEIPLAAANANPLLCEAAASSGVPSVSGTTCPPCGPLYCTNDPGLASAIAAKKAELSAQGYPDRLLKLLDRYKCIACVNSAPDSFSIMIEYAPGHYVTDSTGTWSHMIFPWTAQDEALARVELRRGTIKSFSVFNSMQSCPCCGEKDPQNQPDYNAALDMNTGGMYVYQKPSDLGPDPPDLENIPANLLQQLPPIGTYTKPPRRQIHVTCPNCEALAEKYNTLAGQLDSLWDSSIALQTERDTLDRQIIDRQNQIDNLQYKLNVSGYSYLYQPQIDELQKLNQTDTATFSADYDKLQSVEQQIADVTSQMAALEPLILQCEKTECSPPSPAAPCTAGSPGCTAPTSTSTCQPGSSCNQPPQVTSSGTGLPPVAIGQPGGPGIAPANGAQGVVGANNPPAAGGPTTTTGGAAGTQLGQQATTKTPQQISTEAGLGGALSGTLQTKQAPAAYGSFRGGVQVANKWVDLAVPTGTDVTFTVNGNSVTFTWDLAAEKRSTQVQVNPDGSLSVQVQSELKGKFESHTYSYTETITDSQTVTNYNGMQFIQVRTASGPVSISVTPPIFNGGARRYFASNGSEQVNGGLSRNETIDINAILGQFKTNPSARGTTGATNPSANRPDASSPAQSQSGKPKTQPYLQVQPQQQIITNVAPAGGGEKPSETLNLNYSPLNLNYGKDAKTTKTDASNTQSSNPAPSNTNVAAAPSATPANVVQVDQPGGPGLAPVNGAQPGAAGGNTTATGTAPNAANGGPNANQAGGSQGQSTTMTPSGAVEQLDRNTVVVYGQKIHLDAIYGVDVKPDGNVNVSGITGDSQSADWHFINISKNPDGSVVIQDNSSDYSKASTPENTSTTTTTINGPRTDTITPSGEHRIRIQGTNGSLTIFILDPKLARQVSHDTSDSVFVVSESTNQPGGASTSQQHTVVVPSTSFTSLNVQVQTTIDDYTRSNPAPLAPNNAAVNPPPNSTPDNSSDLKNPSLDTSSFDDEKALEEHLKQFGKAPDEASIRDDIMNQVEKSLAQPNSGTTPDGKTAPQAPKPGDVHSSTITPSTSTPSTTNVAAPGGTTNCGFGQNCANAITPCQPGATCGDTNTCGPGQVCTPPPGSCQNNTPGCGTNACGPGQVCAPPETCQPGQDCGGTNTCGPGQVCTSTPGSCQSGQTCQQNPDNTTGTPSGSQSPANEATAKDLADAALKEKNAKGYSKFGVPIPPPPGVSGLRPGLSGFPTDTPPSGAKPGNSTSNTNATTSTQSGNVGSSNAANKAESAAGNAANKANETNTVSALPMQPGANPSPMPAAASLPGLAPAAAAPNPTPATANTAGGNTTVSEPQPATPESTVVEYRESQNGPSIIRQKTVPPPGAQNQAQNPATAPGTPSTEPAPGVRPRIDRGGAKPGFSTPETIDTETPAVEYREGPKKGQTQTTPAQQQGTTATTPAGNAGSKVSTPPMQSGAAAAGRTGATQGKGIIPGSGSSTGDPTPPDAPAIPPAPFSTPSPSVPSVPGKALQKCWPAGTDRNAACQEWLDIWNANKAAAALASQAVTNAQNDLNQAPALDAAAGEWNTYSQQLNALSDYYVSVAKTYDANAAAASPDQSAQWQQLAADAAQKGRDFFKQSNNAAEQSQKIKQQADGLRAKLDAAKADAAAKTAAADASWLDYQKCLGLPDCPADNPLNVIGGGNPTGNPKGGSTGGGGNNRNVIGGGGPGDLGPILGSLFGGLSGFNGLNNALFGNAPGSPAVQNIIITVNINTGGAAPDGTGVTSGSLQVSPPRVRAAQKRSAVPAFSHFKLVAYHSGSPSRAPSLDELLASGRSSKFSSPLPSAEGLAFSIVSQGTLGSNALEFRVHDPSGKLKGNVALPEGVVLEPLKMGTPNPVGNAAGGNNVAQQLTAYCLEMAKLPPEVGQLYRLAAPAVQQKYQPIRTVLQAGSKLAAAGKFHPDSDPAAYADFIRQHALWAQLENWSEQKFTEVFLERTKKNAEHLNVKWTNEMTDALRAAAPGRWRDIAMVLDEAHKLSGAAGAP